MKLASLKSGRDGQLVVVSKDLTRASLVAEIAPTLQAALDSWADSAPKLQAASDALEAETRDGFAFDQTAVASPLPRAYQWVDGSAYLYHVELVRKARGAEMPPSFLHDPLMYQGGSDSFLGPRDDIALASEDYGIDLEAEVSVITDDVPMGVTPAAAAKHIKLVMLVNDVSLRNLIPAELAKGFGFFHAKPSSAFSPVAVTPDELGEAWQDSKLHLSLHAKINGKWLGSPNAGEDMNFSLAELVAHAAKTRPLVAGTIVGSGTVSNRKAGTGSCCLAEVRTIETIETGSPKTPFLKFGDRVSIEMLDTNGETIFGTIDQKVVSYRAPQE
ncbi:fumarylacetoacetate hydrolase family protein [Govanella unica]|uniref:Fumarylacetoacetate hydrolase family protein n=1 Tax=Govanella unica TaxID=2975056 RepID=A0A9X3Z6Z0_9PROT|nr:fumarylacetoacetate hydrolase family protein [Govania unica]MDA5193429.1 fumarylacetoacetate hydrolase family protein [Govania unica]